MGIDSRPFCNPAREQQLEDGWMTNIVTLLHGHVNDHLQCAETVSLEAYEVPWYQLSGKKIIIISLGFKLIKTLRRIQGFLILMKSNSCIYFKLKSTWVAQCLGLSFFVSSSLSSSSSGSCSPGGGSATSRGKMACRIGFSSFCFNTA